MAHYSDEEEKENNVEEDSLEEGFMQGFEEDEEEVELCAECGAAIKPERKITKTIENEDYHFCSKTCAKEYEESQN